MHLSVLLLCYLSVCSLLYFDICYRAFFPSSQWKSHMHVCLLHPGFSGMRHEFCVMTSRIYHTHAQMCMYPLNLQSPLPREYTSPSKVGPFSSSLRAVPSSSMPCSYESHCDIAGNMHADVHAHMWVRTRRRHDDEAFVSTPPLSLFQ